MKLIKIITFLIITHIGLNAFGVEKEIDKNIKICAKSLDKKADTNILIKNGLYDNVGKWIRTFQKLGVSKNSYEFKTIDNNSFDFIFYSNGNSDTEVARFLYVKTKSLYNEKCFILSKVYVSDTGAIYESDDARQFAFHFGLPVYERER